MEELNEVKATEVQDSNATFEGQATVGNPIEHAAETDTDNDTRNGENEWSFDAKIASLNKDLHKERTAKKEWKQKFEAGETLAATLNARIADLESEILEVKTVALLRQHNIQNPDDIGLIDSLPTLEQREVLAKRMDNTPVINTPFGGPATYQKPSFVQELTTGIAKIGGKRRK